MDLLIVGGASLVQQMPPPRQRDECTLATIPINLARLNCLDPNLFQAVWVLKKSLKVVHIQHVAVIVQALFRFNKQIAAFTAK